MAVVLCQLNFCLPIFRIGVAQDLAQWFQDQRDRGSEFVGDVVEKIGFDLFQGFDALCFPVFKGKLFERCELKGGAGKYLRGRFDEEDSEGDA